MADLRDQIQSGLADRYRLEHELGRGGMATVFLAHDIRHKRPVALKVLHSELARTLGPERFQREIETVARLQHPHILTVHDSGEAAGQLWFTMPFVEGESLRDRLRREQQLPVEDALRIATDAARALQYAHEHGVIHRDIKPENLLLTKDGSTLVADFGIARALSAGDDRLTETGLSVGTPTYMSPEQAAGDRTVDARTDVYSLGTVLYEMLAGEPPFTGATAQTIIAKRFSGEVPRVRHARPSVPESVEQAVTRALAPVAADRFPSAAEFSRALQSNVPSPMATPTVPLARAQGGSSHRAAAPHGRPLRRIPPAATALFLGFFIGLGVLFAWRRSHPDVGDAGGANVVAVLPFENLGDSSQAYFADGVSDEVRGKLSQLAGLAVIARASSNEYRNTSKPPQQIARELSADYLLTATVRWQQHPDGTSRVRVSPELIRVEPGAAPRTKWQQGFDAPLTNVFQVQADIASQVAQALNVALGDSTRRELATKPTQSLPAYDAFLRGEAASQGMSAIDPPSLRQAIAAYEQAVALDSSFALAWAQLARAQAMRYLIGALTPAQAEAARAAAERALALAPNRPEGHQALAAYYSSVPRDLVRAYTEDSTALALAPRNGDLLAAVGWDERNLGRWEAARGHLEQAARLDPRSGTTAHRLGELLLNIRDYPAAERVLEHALQLLPANLGVRADRATVALAQGHLSQARAIINAAPKEVDPTALVAFVATYQDLIWVLDEAQQQLLRRLTPSAFDDSRGMWGSVIAQTYALEGNTAKARAYADSARQAMEQELRVAPQDAQRRVFLGLALAYLGQKAAAIREGERAVAMLPISRDAFFGPYLQHQLARIYLLVGEPEMALDQLEPLLSFPYPLSPGWLKIDPNFDTLRGNPRFERLMNGL
ncbi:MAG: protein kinase [Gemmatimonadales bacterium]|nr:protein kinase [Gemmatimonadales bacterium]